MLVLAALFLLTAALYATVGFGGGSTYNALLALSGTDYRILPAIALVCNIVVVTGGSIRFARAGLVPWRRVWPILLLSAPFASLGGLTPIAQKLFIGLLGATLLLAGLTMLFQREARQGDAQRGATWIAPVAGIGIGYLSGLVGIGGGIFLAPLLHLLRWDGPKQIAATASMFILVNSITGLAGQIVKVGDSGVAPLLLDHWPLALAVLVGGQIGSIASLKLFSPLIVKRLTAILVLYVSAQLLVRYWAM
jgi:uncharacterized protein